MKQGSFARLAKLLGLAKSNRAQLQRQRKNRKLFVEGLEERKLMATFAQGDIALLGINSANPDTFRFTNLKAMDAGDVIHFTDNGFTAGATGRTGEGFLSFTAPTGGVAAGSIFTWQNGMTITGTPWNSAAPNNFSFNGSGDQLFVFSGSTSNWASQSGITLLYGINYVVALSTTSNAANTVQPTALTSGFLNLPSNTNANGYYSGTGSSATTVAITGTASTIFNDLLTPAKWFGNSSTASVFPTHTVTIGSATAPSLSIAATSATQTEGNSGDKAFTFTVTRSVDTAGTNTVDYAVTGGTTNPADGTDFGGTFPSGTLTFHPTETTKTITINVSGDTTVELDNSFVVTLSSPSSPAVIGTATASGLIQNDDSSFSIAALSANNAEGNSGSTPFTFTITRTGNTTTAATVDFAAAGSGANPTDAADFSGAASGTASFAIGATTATITLNVAGDTTPESNETFDVTLSNAVGSGAISAIVGTPASATGTIQNDDAATTIAIAATDASKAEGNTGTTNFTFTVTRSGVTTGTSSATWTVTGSGTNPASTTTDITAPLTGTVSFAAGETSQVITVLVTGDTNIELDEQFTVTLSAPSSGTAISTAAAIGLIVNDDLSLALPTTPSTTIEGNSGSTTVSVTVTRTGDTSIATSVDWAVTGSGTNAANAADFVGGVLPSGTITFAIGQTTQTISFNIQGDTTVELDETYTLTLSNASGGAVIGTATQAGTITSDDVVILAAGDIAFTGYNGITSPERVSFVVLNDIPSLAVINFTDNGFNSNGTFNTNEGLTQVAFTSAVSAGTRFYLEGVALFNFDGTPAPAIVTGSASGLSNSGDQVTAYQGTAVVPTAILASISSTLYITTGSINTNTSYLPTGLTLGTTAISLGNSGANGVLNSADPDIGTAVTGSQTNILGRVNNVTNWTVGTQANLVVPPAITFTVGLLTPVINVTAPNAVYTGVAYAGAGVSVTGAGSPAPVTSFTYYTGSGVVPANVLSSAPTNVGTYTVVATSPANEGNTAATSNAVTFNITPAPLTITAEAKSKAFGASDPALTFTTSSFVPGETASTALSGTLIRVAGETPGTYAIEQGSVTAVNGNYAITYQGALLTIAAAPAPTFTGASVNGGDTFLNNAQRSQITSLVLNFSAPVVVAANAFTVANVGLFTAQTAAALASSQILVTGSGTNQITLRWGTGSGVQARLGSGALGNSLMDGNWQLTIDPSKITTGGTAMTGNATFGTLASDNFFRMYGDSNGDGVSSGNDLSAYRTALTTFNAAFDFNGDGVVNSTGVDYTNFVTNYGKRRRTR